MGQVSLERSIKIFELSGMTTGHWQSSRPDLTDHWTDLPVYDLSFLLQKLPRTRVNKIHRVRPGVVWSNKHQKWCTYRARYGVGPDNDEWKIYEYKADTPEEAVAILVIVLLEQGVMGREK